MSRQFGKMTKSFDLQLSPQPVVNMMLHVRAEMLIGDASVQDTFNSTPMAFRSTSRN